MKLESPPLLIDNEELRGLFQAECREILALMEEGLLALERSPLDRAALERVFRQAHSLKGAAAGLGVGAVESVAHQFEDILDDARNQRQVLTSAAADRLYQALDVLGRLVDEAVTGKPSGVDLRAFLEHLKSPLESAAGAPDESFVETPVEALEAIVGPEADALQPQIAGSVLELGQAARVEVAPSTIRVDTMRLDRALAEMGDLVVTTARLDLRRAQAQELQGLYETWMREARWKDATALAQGEVFQRFGRRLERLIQALTDDHSRLKQITDHLQEDIREMRLLPLSGLLQRFPRMTRDLAQAEKKKIQMVLEGSETTADRRILEGLKSPLTHLLRNAVDHGIETPEERRAGGKPEEAIITLSAARRGATLEVVMRDDGAGLNYEAIRRKALVNRLRNEDEIAQMTERELSSLLFVPGFSTRDVVSELSGRGTGLDAVRSDVEALHGSVSVESHPGSGTSFILRVPLTIATSQVLICRLEDRIFGVPLGYVERSNDYDPQKTFQVGGRTCLEISGSPVALSALAPMLECSTQAAPQVCLVLRDQTERHGFLVEELLGVMELVVKPFRESRLVSGVSILADGDLCLILQPSELFRLARQTSTVIPSSEGKAVSARVLFVEDSSSLRALGRQVLTQAGYRVTVAQDGEEAWEMAREHEFEAVVTDIEMPRMDGLELTRRLRATPAYRQTPIVLVTSLQSEASRQAGLQAGASAFLSKQSTNEGTLLSILERLV